MMLGRIPVHPVLVGAFPVLLLWVMNGGEVPPGDGTTVLLVAVAAVAGTAAVAALALRDARRGALVASAGGALALTHGHLWGTGGLLPLLVGLPVAALAVGATVWRVRRLEPASTARATLVVNVVAALLVAGTLPGVVASVRSATAAPVAPADGTLDARIRDAAAAPDEVAPRPGARDVVWIVPDRHGSERGLAHTFGVDTGDFTTALRTRGFEVADHARANYPKTSHALAAALGLDYLDELAAAVPDAAQDSSAPLAAALDDHEVGRWFRAAGYDHVHLGSWWGLTSQSSAADVVLTRGAGNGAPSEFAQVFMGTTILHPLGIGTEQSDLRSRHRTHAEWQLDRLDDIARELVQVGDDAPRFVFVHLLLPHEPYVFDRDGDLVDAATEGARSEAENYQRQVTYLQQRLLRTLDTVAAAPDDREPIVLLQADEGPHPVRKTNDADFAWSEATDAELVTKFSILSALRVPGEQVDLRPDATAINVARLLVNTALGTTLAELPDRSYIFPDEDHRYEFIDVTARVDLPD